MLGDKKMQHAWMKYAEFNDIPHDHEDEEPFKQGFAMGRTDSGQLAELAALKTKLDAAISLHECVECGQPAFSISPIDPHDGFCWNCHKLLTVRPTLCGCAIREAGSSVCHKCHRPYYHDGHVFTGRNA